MRCKKCGAENPSEREYCARCGNVLEPPEGEWEAPELKPVWTPSVQPTEQEDSKNILGGIGALVVLLSMAFPFVSWIGEFQLWDVVDEGWAILFAIAIILACIFCFKGSRGAGALGGAYLLFEIVAIADGLDWGVSLEAGFWLGAAGSVMMIISAFVHSDQPQPQTRSNPGGAGPRPEYAGGAGAAAPMDLMSGPTTGLFEMESALYQTGAPVCILSGKLLKSERTGYVLAQLKLQNLSQKPIKAVRVVLFPSDVFGTPMENAVEHQYLDLSARRGDDIGEDSPIQMPDVKTRAFTVTVATVLFDDMSVWTAPDAPWEPIPEPTPLEKAYPDPELRRQFKLEFGTRSLFAYGEYSDLWRCPCGRMNRKEEEKCHFCERDRLALRALKTEDLEKRKNERLEQKRLEEEEKLRRERLAKEKAEAEAAERARKSRTTTIAVSIVAGTVTVVMLVLFLVILPSIKYNNAAALMRAGRYSEAIEAFEAMDGYRDSEEKIAECETAILDERYDEAEKLLAAGEDRAAAVAFGEISGHRDAKERSFAAWQEVTDRSMIAPGNNHTVGLKSDGTVVAVGRNSYGQCDVDGWTDIATVTAGSLYTVALKSDGTVVAAGSNAYHQCNVDDWTDIVSIAAGNNHTVGLKLDGSVVAVGNEGFGQCNVDGWTDIVAIAAGNNHTVALKSDGSVAAAGSGSFGQCDVDDWSDIVAIAAGSAHTVGLKADGTVVAVGGNSYHQCDVDEWTDIVAIAAGNNHTVGLRSDGTVVAVGGNGYGQCEMDDWTDIVAIAAGNNHTVGLKSDGTVVAAGNSSFGQCDVGEWTDIRLPE